MSAMALQICVVAPFRNVHLEMLISVMLSDDGNNYVASIIPAG